MKGRPDARCRDIEICFKPTHSFSVQTSVYLRSVKGSLTFAVPCLLFSSISYFSKTVAAEIFLCVFVAIDIPYYKSNVSQRSLSCQKRLLYCFLFWKPVLVWVFILYLNYRLQSDWYSLASISYVVLLQASSVPHMVKDKLQSIGAMPSMCSFLAGKLPGPVVLLVGLFAMSERH